MSSYNFLIENQPSCPNYKALCSANQNFKVETLAISKPTTAIAPKLNLIPKWILHQTLIGTTSQLLRLTCQQLLVITATTVRMQILLEISIQESLIQVMEEMWSSLIRRIARMRVIINRVVSNRRRVSWVRRGINQDCKNSIRLWCMNKISLVEWIHPYMGEGWERWQWTPSSSRLIHRRLT